MIHPDAPAIRRPEHASAALKQQLAASFQRTVTVMSSLRAPNVDPGPDAAGSVSSRAAVTDVTLITSADDPRLSDYRSLTDVALRRKIEPANGLFIAEGEKVVRRALAAGYEMRSLLCAASRAADLADLPGPQLVADYDVLEAVTGFHVHRGVLAAMARRAARDRGRGPARGSSGSWCSRSCRARPTSARSSAAPQALGIDGIILAPTCGDPLYRRAVRVSMGQVFAIPYARCESWPEPTRRAPRSRAGACWRSPRPPSAMTSPRCRSSRRSGSRC